METMRDVVACPLHPAPTCMVSDPSGSSAMNEAPEHGKAADVASSHTSPHHDWSLGGWEGAQEGGCSLHPPGSRTSPGMHNLAKPRGDRRRMEERLSWP